MCDDVASGTAPTTGPSQHYQVGMALTVDTAFEEEAIFEAMTSVLNTEIAPFLLGCSSGEVQRHELRRQLQTTELRNIVFSEPIRNQTGENYQKRCQPYHVCVVLLT